MHCKPFAALYRGGATVPGTAICLDRPDGPCPPPAGTRSPASPRPDALRRPVDRHRGGIRPGSGPVVTRFGVLDPLPTSLDTPLMPRRRVRNRLCDPLGAARRLSNCPSPAHRRSDQARSARTRSAQPMSPTARPVVSLPSPSSPARADRLRDPRHPPRPPPPAGPASSRRIPVVGRSGSRWPSRAGQRGCGGCPRGWCGCSRRSTRRAAFGASLTMTAAPRDHSACASAQPQAGTTRTPASCRRESGGAAFPADRTESRARPTPGYLGRLDRRLPRSRRARDVSPRPRLAATRRSRTEPESHLRTRWCTSDAPTESRRSG